MRGDKIYETPKLIIIIMAIPSISPIDHQMPHMKYMRVSSTNKITTEILEIKTLTNKAASLEKA